MSDLSRAPLTLVEWDVDFCQNTYGVAPCTASGSAGEECYNTNKTCQDLANFNLGSLTLTFSENINTGIKGKIIFPALRGVSTNASRLGLSRVQERSSDRLGSLGKRARVVIKFKDFAWSDRIVDPYVDTRSYTPLDQGTFFAKLRARSPYYYGRAIRVKHGVVGDDPATMFTRNYVITDWKGPDNGGNVEITAQDPMRLFDEEFAQCPEPVQGEIQAAISDSFTGDVELNTGSGADYATSGFGLIGDEIVAFTRSGDTITITDRAQDGSEASSHSVGDTFQQCYRAEEERLYDVLEDLLANFAGIDGALLPTADWEAEINRWLPSLRLTRTIPRPRSVKSLVSEMLDLGILFWWDEVDQEFKLRVNRPPDIGETVTPITDEANIIERSTGLWNLDEQRLSRVRVWHGYINAAESMDDDTNYSRVPFVVDVDAESDVQYGQIREMVLYLPWLGPVGDDTIANNVGFRLVNRYRNTPQRLKFLASNKDRDDVRLAALTTITSRLLQDTTGASLPTEMQVTSVEEYTAQRGNRLMVTAETYQFSGRFAFIGENSATDYASATQTQKDTVVHLSDGTNNFADGTPPYILF